jgi:hypothetical protein
MLVFFTFMPVGARTGGIGGAVFFGVMAVRDDAIAIQPGPPARNEGRPGKQSAFVRCKIAFAFPLTSPI